MTGQCGLEPDINNCQYFIKEKRGCKADHQGCGFYELPGTPKEAIKAKEPKWFERYYKK